MAVTQGKGELTHTMEGKKDGTYDQLFIDKGFIGGVHAPTAKGITDDLAGQGHEMTFDGETARPVTLTAGTQDHLATIEGKTSGAAVSLNGSNLTLDNHGPATTFKLTLESVTPGKGVAHFVSGGLRVGKGKKLRVAADWLRLRAVKVNGHRVRNHAARLSVRVKAKATRKQLTLRFAKVPPHTVAGVVARIGGKRKAFSVKKLRAGKRTFKLSGKHGALRVDVIVSALGAKTGARHLVFRKRV
jgi:hypothetical protein